MYFRDSAFLFLTGKSVKLLPHSGIETGTMILQTKQVLFINKVRLAHANIRAAKHMYMSAFAYVCMSERGKQTERERVRRDGERVS